jgi:Rrf2 family protein
MGPTAMWTITGRCTMWTMRISAKADYAVRAAIELAAAEASVPAERIADEQQIPLKYLESILTDLRKAGLVRSRRGAGGGHELRLPAADVTVADIIRAVDGPLVSVRGERPPDLEYRGSSAALLPLWVGLRSNVRHVLEGVTLADLAAGTLPEEIRLLSADAEAWTNP